LVGSRVIDASSDRSARASIDHAAKGLTGLGSFATEVRQFAGISDSQRLLMRLLSESVTTFDATGGAAELRGHMAPFPRTRSAPGMVIPA
jgi:hypothetical protein